VEALRRCGQRGRRGGGAGRAGLWCSAAGQRREHLGQGGPVAGRSVGGQIQAAALAAGGGGHGESHGQCDSYYTLRTVAAVGDAYNVSIETHS
jgi:hypothetical protein